MVELMTAVAPVSSLSLSAVTSAVSRVGALAQPGAPPPISPVSPVVPHKNPPAGLLAFDPFSPEVDLSSQPVEQMRALHQFRANLSYFQKADQASQSSVNVEA